MDVKKKTRKEHELEQRKALVLNCAEELFAESGFDETSMAMIAEKSEFAVGSVYNFFSSKKEIFNAIVIERLDEVNQGIDEIIAMSYPCRKAIRELIAYGFDFFARNRNFIRIYLYELTRLGWGLPTTFADEVNVKLTEVIDKMKQVISIGQDEKVIRQDLNCERINIIYFEIMISYLVYWLKEEEKTDLRDYSDEMYEIFMNGIGARK